MVTQETKLTLSNKPYLTWIKSHQEDVILWTVSTIVWLVHLILMNGYWFMSIFFLIPIIAQLLNLFVFHDNNFVTSIQYFSLFLIIGWIPVPLILEPTWLLMYPWGIVMIVAVVFILVLMVLKNKRITRSRIIKKFLIEEEKKKLSSEENSIE
jgi:hypothetical protein